MEIPSIRQRSRQLLGLTRTHPPNLADQPSDLSFLDPRELRFDDVPSSDDFEVGSEG